MRKAFSGIQNNARHTTKLYAAQCMPSPSLFPPHISHFVILILPSSLLHDLALQIFSIPCALNTKIATTTPATNAIKPSQKHQQIHVRCRFLRCWLASQLSLFCGLAAALPVMVVHVLKTVRGRPEREREEGQRRECRIDGGRCSVFVSCGVGREEVGYVLKLMLMEEDCLRCERRGRVLALEADFFNFDGCRLGLCFCGSCISLFSRR